MASLGLALTVQAQDDPFGGAEGLFGEAPAAEADPTEQDQDLDPLTRQLIERSRRGNVQLAQSVQALARIGRWSQVDRLLSSLAGKELSAPTLAEMSQTIGPSVSLQIAQQEDLSDPARAALERLSQARIAQAESPDRLRAAIADLGSPSVDTRLGATRTLLFGGNVAITELVAAAVSTPPPAPRDEILRTLLALGPGGVEALGQLALYGSPEVRHLALAALARIDREAHLEQLVTAKHAADADPRELQVADQALARMTNRPPGRTASVEFLLRDLEDKRKNARSIENDDQSKTVWLVNPEQTGVSPVSASLIDAAYRSAADAAARLRRIGNHSLSTQASILAADLAYRVKIDPDWGDPEQLAQVRDSYGGSLSNELISTALESALADRDVAAMVGLIRLVASEDSPPGRSELLTASGSTSSPMVQAASDPDPRVRYEAALAAARWGAGTPYPGSSLVERTLREMTTLAEQPSAILVETRPDQILRLEQILGDVGIHLDVVGSVGQLERRLARGGDLRMIISKTELPDLTAIEMIDRVRRTARGAEIPIVLYGSPIEGIGQGRWQAPVFLIDPPASLSAFDETWDRAERARRLPPLSVLDRQFYRTAALEMLDPNS